MNQEPHVIKGNKSDVDDAKAFAALGYIWVLCLVPLLLKRSSQYAQFHGKQGLMLFIFEIFISIVWVVPILGWIIAIVGWVYVVIMIGLGIIKSLQGEYWEMPILGKYAKSIEI